MYVEILKAKKSGIFKISIIATVFMALVLGFLYFVIKNPDIARAYALIAAKASIAGNADWVSFFNVQGLLCAVAGFIGFSFITSWVFGREYSDRTLNDLLSLPVSRISIILSKFLTIFIWCVFLSILLYIFSLFAGYLVGLADFSMDILIQGAIRFIIVLSLSLFLITPIAFLASFGRGVLPPLGFIVLLMVLVQVLNVIGYGQYFPWAIPLLASGAAGPGGPMIGTSNYIIVAITGLIGFFGTLAWWRFADQK
jgi:ABC-2 type transport system permease protein